MNNAQKAGLVIGGLAVGTVGVGIVSVVAWSIIPLSLWGIGCAVVGNQTMNVLRIRDGKLQPQHIVNVYDGKVEPIKKTS